MGKVSGMRAVIGGVIAVLAIAGCGGGGGSEGSGWVPTDGLVVKTADYWYDDPDTVVVFIRDASFIGSASETLRLTPLADEMTADGPVWGWASDSISSNLSARQWMYASAREDGIYTTTMQTQGPASGFERELPANLVTGQPTETTVDAVVFDQDGSEYPARLTTVTTATLLDSLALTRFEVADVLMVERSHRYVLQDRPSPGAVLVAQDMAWYGRGVGLVKSETGGLVSMGEPMPVLEIVELRGFQSPTRAIGNLPGMTAISREALVDALSSAPGSGVTSANRSTRQVTIDTSVIAAGDPGFMVVAGFSSGSSLWTDPPEPYHSGLVVMTADPAGRPASLRVGPAAMALSIAPSGLVFDGSRFWLLGGRSDAPSEPASPFLARIAPDGRFLDDADPQGLAGCAAVAGLPVVRTNGRSVVIASVVSQEVFPGAGAGPTPQPSYTHRVHWCAYDLDRRPLVSGITSPVEGRELIELRFIVTESGDYVLNLQMTDMSPAGNYAFAELVLDAFGNAPDTTLRTVPTSPPQSLGGGLREWPGAQDLGRYSSFISLAPGNRIVLSESGARAVIHGSLPEEWTSPDAALTWSLLIPERDGW